MICTRRRWTGALWPLLVACLALGRGVAGSNVTNATPLPTLEQVWAGNISAVDALNITMAAWTGCEEWELPAFIPIGVCNTSSCQRALDRNDSTWNFPAVLKTDRWLFGAYQGEEVGDTDGIYIGIDLQEYRSFLMNITITPRERGPGEWDPRKHPYNPPANVDLDWAEGLVGAKVQGSDDLLSWVDLHTVRAAPSPVLRAPFPDMTAASCVPYRAFRLWVPQNYTRTFYINTADGPVHTRETVSFASLTDISFSGVRSRGGGDNVLCLNLHPNLVPMVDPIPNAFPHFINLTWSSHLSKCPGAVLVLTSDGTDPTTSSPSKAFGTTVDLEPDEVLGTESSAISSAAVLYAGYLSRPQSGVWTFPDTVLTAVCEPGWTVYESWCYKWYGLEEARSFEDAERHCLAQDGAHLASIWSKENNAFVRSLKPDGASGAASIAWVGLNVSGEGGSTVAWTDGSRVTYSNWMQNAPLHPNRTCAMLGAGDWYLSECSEAQGKGCSNRVWGEWLGGWGDTVGLPWRSESEECYNNQLDPVAPARGECWRDPSEGTETHDPCLQALPFVCKRRGPLVCIPGYFNAQGSQPCSRCAQDTYSGTANSTECTACREGSTSDASNSGCEVTVEVNASGAFPDGCGVCLWVTSEEDVTPPAPNVTFVQPTTNSTNGTTANGTTTNGTNTTNASSVIQESLSVSMPNNTNGTNGTNVTNVTAPTLPGLEPYSTCDPSRRNASTGRVGFDVVNVSRAAQNMSDQVIRRSGMEYTYICCGIPSLGLPQCSSLLAAQQVAENYYPEPFIQRTVSIAPGYYRPKAETWFNKSVAITCPDCTGRSLPPHLADVILITSCLHSGSNDYHTYPPPERPDPKEIVRGGAGPPGENYNPTEPYPTVVPLATGHDNCDPQTLAAEATECPPGYTLIPEDLNPGPSIVYMCYRLSQKAERISELVFIQTNNTVGREHTCAPGFELVGEVNDEPLTPGRVRTPFPYESYPITGFRSGAVDLWDGVGGNEKVFLCVRREGGLIRANLSVTSGACAGTPAEAEAVPGTAYSLCLPLIGDEVAVFDALSGPRVLAFGCESCKSTVSNITLLSSRVEPTPYGPGGEIGDMCDGDDVGGAILIRGGGVYEFIDVSVFNSSAKCGGGVFLGGNASARFTNCSLLENAARGASDGSGGVGAGLLAYSRDYSIQLGQQWDSGSWALPPSREAMHTENAGPMTAVPNRNALDANWEFGALDMEGGITLVVRDSWIAYNEAQVAGGAPSGHGLRGMGGVGGGLAFAHGRVWLSNNFLDLNGADSGSGIAAVGDRGAEVCHTDVPALPNKRAAHCAHTVTRTRTSVRVEDSEVRRQLRRPHTSQILNEGVESPCETYFTPHCWAFRTRFSAWDHTLRVGLENRDPTPGQVYLQHATALLDNITYSDAEAVASVKRCAMAHTACLLPMSGAAGGEAGRQCFSHQVLRFPCCQTTVECQP